MTEHSTSVKQELDAGEQPYRRRNTDNPQPLDNVTRELVREIIEKRRQERPAQHRTFIEKLLGED